LLFQFQIGVPVAMVSFGVSRRLDFWFVCCALTLGSVWPDDYSSTTLEDNKPLIPETLSSPFGAYPNLLSIDDDDRQHFYPVIPYPNRTVRVNDKTNAQDLASPKDIHRAKRRNTWWRRLARRVAHKVIAVVTLGKKRPGDHLQSPTWAIGKYDENRVGMYTSELFQDASNTIDGYGGLRTVHLGIDLGAPVGTKVFAFCDGVVHSAGCNAEFGDYGYVVVIEHDLPTDGKRVWALYGHLTKDSIRGKRPGSLVKKGQVIGRVGDCHENGGWLEPHVHFQLSMNPPETHDMPGASSMEEREKALMDYPDPRYVLGAIH
jgi:hypothetical protein